MTTHDPAAPVAPEIERQVAEIMARPYRKVITGDATDGFLATVPELPGCATAGETEEEALALLHDAMELWLISVLERGLSVPEPGMADQYSGRVLVRMPRSLHRRLMERAEEEGVSANQLAVAIFAEGLAAGADLLARTTPQPTRGVQTKTRRPTASERAALEAVRQIPDSTLSEAFKAAERGGSGAAAGLDDLTISEAYRASFPSIADTIASMVRDPGIQAGILHAAGIFDDQHFSTSLVDLAAEIHELSTLNVAVSDGATRAALSGMADSLMTIPETVSVANLNDLTDAVATFAASRDLLPASLWDQIEPLTRGVFDQQVQAYLDMSGEDFLRRWDEGELAGDDPDPEIVVLAAMIPLVRKAA